MKACDLQNEVYERVKLSHFWQTDFRSCPYNGIRPSLHCCSGIMKADVA